MSDNHRLQLYYGNYCHYDDLNSFQIEKNINLIDSHDGVGSQHQTPCGKGNTAFNIECNNMCGA